MTVPLENKAPISAVETVTPARAKELLDTMGPNRKISVRAVKRLADDITNGTFTLNNDAICIDPFGCLINGQHRLTACVMANKPIESLILWNIPRDSVLDFGRKRSISDLLTFGGDLPSDFTTKDCVSTIRSYYYCKRNFHSDLSPHMFSEFISVYGESVALAVSFCRRGGKPPLCQRAPISAAVFAALECGISEKILSRFTEVVNSGFAEGNEENAAIILRKYLESIKGNPGTWTSNIQTSAYAEKAISEFIKKNPARYWKNVDLTKHPFIDACAADF